MLLAGSYFIGQVSRLQEGKRVEVDSRSPEKYLESASLSVLSPLPVAFPSSGSSRIRCA